MRTLTDNEKIAISRMADTLPEPQRSRLIADLAIASADPLNSDGSIVRFSIAGYRPARRNGRTVAVDGVVTDSDGAELNVILFTDDNGRLYELELVRFHHGSVIAPDWDTLRAY